MEEYREKDKDGMNKENNSKLPIHRKVCSFIDRLDFHPNKSGEIPKEFFENIEDKEHEEAPNYSILFADSARVDGDAHPKSDHGGSNREQTKSGFKIKLKKNSSQKFSFNKKGTDHPTKQDRINRKKRSQKKKIHEKRERKIEKKKKKKLFKKNESTSTTLLGWKGKKKKNPHRKTKNKQQIKEVDQKQQIPTQLSKNKLAEHRIKELENTNILNTESWEEVDFYELAPPFIYVSVMRDKDTKDRRYLVLEEKLTNEEEKQFHFIVDALETYSINVDEIEDDGSTQVLQKEVDEIIEDYGLTLSALSKEKIRYAIQKNLLGFGKIHPLMKDPNIEDISCDGAGLPIFLYHRNHGSIQSNIAFVDEDELSGFVMRLAQKCGKHISIAHPMLDATMPDGSRIQMTLSTEVSTKGSTFTIRKFREQPFSPTDLIRFNSFSSEMIAYFWLAIEHGVNGLIAGGTAAGKTSALNAMALFIPRESKIVSIEETREINLPHPNWIPGVSRSGFGDVVAGKMAGEIDLYDLMKAALRQRPEYILVGEIRGREAYVLFQAMATGHTTYSTVHADSTKSLIHRLEGEPINIPRIMLQSLDVVCLQTIARVKNKRARRCKQVIEIIDIDPTTKEILTNEVFRWDPIEDTFLYSGKSYILEQIRSETNQSREEITAELKQRAKVLEWMVDHNIHMFDEVASITAQYQDHPGDVLKKMKGEL